MLKSRAMTTADITAIADIEAEAMIFPWTKKLFEDSLRAGHHCQVYFTDSIPFIAYTIAQQIMDETHLLNICVAKRHQRQGHGKDALGSVINFANENESATILLEVRASNQQAQRLYQCLGFIEITVRENYYPAEQGREDAILMARVLFNDFQ